MEKFQNRADIGAHAFFGLYGAKDFMGHVIDLIVVMSLRALLP